MPGGGFTVVSCGVRYNARTGKLHARLTRQEPLGAARQYVRYASYFDSWTEVVAWFGTF
jgi:hypothetical protein